MAKLDGTAVCMDFTLPVLNNDIISFSVEKQHNHQSHYKAEAEGGKAREKEGGALCPLRIFKLFPKHSTSTSVLIVLKCTHAMTSQYKV